MSDRSAEEHRVTAEELARWLAISPKDVYDLTRAGVLVRGVGRRFELEANVRRYIMHLRGQSLKATDDPG
jgi:hypothetical protein